MSKLSAKTCETARPKASGGDRLLGDGDGLFLRVRPQGTKMWLVKYEFQGRRRKYTIGVFDADGVPGESITSWLEHGWLSPAQARDVAGHWKQDRRGGRDPAAERMAGLAAKREGNIKCRHRDHRQRSTRGAVPEHDSRHNR